MAEGKNTLDSVLLSVETVVNFLPRKLGKVGEDNFGPLGKYSGYALGYIADLAVASFVPLVGGSFLATGVAVGAPALRGYKYMIHNE